MEDFQHQMRFIQKALEEDENPMNALKYTYDWLREAIAFGKEWRQKTDQEMDEERKQWIEHFLRRDLPKIVTLLAERRFKDEDVKEAVNQFLQQVLLLVIEYIPIIDLEEIPKMLKKIFDERTKFYYEFEYTEEEFLTPEDFAIVPEWRTYQEKVPGLLVENINFFGSRGGFDVILNRIRTVPKPEISYINLLLKPIFQIRKTLKHNFLENWVPHLKNHIFQQLNSMTEQQLKEMPRKSFLVLMDIIDSFVSLVYSQQKAGKIIEMFKLNFSLKCLRSESLERRLNGLSDVNELIVMAFERENEKIPSKSSPIPPSTRWLDFEYLTNWIIEQNILNEIFGEKIHHESIKRSIEIFKLYARKKVLKESHLDLLWNSSLGNQQETLVDSLYKVIKQLSPLLNCDQLDYILEKIRLLPHEHYNKSLLKLVRKLTVSSLSNTSYLTHGKWIGLEILWSSVKNPNLPEDLRLEALSILSQVLRESPSKREQFITWCIENLKNNEAVSFSLKLLKQLIGMYGQKSFQIIKKLQIEHNLLQLLLQELFQFKKGIMVGSLTENENQKYLKELGARLKFLKFILNTSDLALNIQQIDLLWECLIVNAISSSDQNEGFQWFAKSAFEESLYENYLVTCKYILVEKLSKLDFNESGFDCFEVYFRLINGNENRLAHWMSQDFFIISFDLTGLDTLWNIALYSKNTVVVEKAIKYLNSLYDKMSIKLKAEIVKYYEEYIQNVVNTLKKAMEPTVNSELVERCLSLLQNFIETCEENIFRKKGDPVFINFHQVNGFIFQLQFQSKNTLGEVRYKVAKRLEISSSLIRFVSHGTQLTEMNKTLEELGIINDSIIYCVTNSPSTLEQSQAESQQETEPIEQTERKETQLAASPSILLSQHQQFYEIIFSLLDLVMKGTNSSQPITGYKAWKFISSLPLNPQLRQQVISFFDVPEKEKWDELLTTRSPLKFHYYVRIIESLVLTPTEDTDLHKWRQNFSENGIEYLYQVLITDQVIQQNQACLSSLLKIINFFVISYNGSISPGIILNQNIKLAKEIRFPELLEKLLFFMWNVVTPQNNLQITERKEVEVMRDSLQLLIAVIALHTNLLNELLSKNSFKDLIYFLFLKNENKGLRFEFGRGILDLCSLVKSSETANNCPEYFISILVGMLSEQFDHSNCEEYFSLLCSLLKMKQVDSLDFWITLASQVINLIDRHSTFEIYPYSPPDQLLIGLIRLLWTIIQINPKFKQELGKSNFIQRFFFSALFSIPTAEMHGKKAPPKCKTKQSRVEAFNLLRELAIDCRPNYQILMTLIENYHFNPSNKRWDFFPPAKSRSPVGYVGLKNMGCTCYMNSLIQQLFMLPSFRKGLLSLDFIPHFDLKENLIYQLQVLFSFLQESQRRSFDPYSFCLTNKDFDGNPINVNEQMDVDEYFNHLCEKLDDGLKEKIQAKLLQNIWAGKLSSQLICKGCPHRYERDDPFYTVSLDIKGKSNILEALDLYVKGEMLERDNAYYCEKCSQKRDTLKRTCIKRLPNTLILHLKRFEFDLEQMKKVKLNDYCEFPMELNMKPYTTVGLAQKEMSKESNFDLIEDEDERKRLKELKQAMETRPPSYYEYHLAGILVHMGGSDSGHYYSFIKERITKGNKEPQWIEFNDKHVTLFETKNIQNECFGGTETVIRYDQATRTRKSEIIEKNRNAYMLIYERNHFQLPEQNNENENQDKIPVKKKAKRVSIWTPFFASLFISKLLVKKRESSNEDTFTVDVPKELYHQVWEDNQHFLKDTKIFDEDNFHFIYSLFLSNEIVAVRDYNQKCTDPLFECIRLETLFFLQVLSLAYQRTILQEYMRHLLYLYQNHTPACKWFCEYLLFKESLVRKVLLECPAEDVRSATADLILVVVQALLKYEESSLFSESMDSEPSLTVQVLHTLYSWLDYDNYNYRYFDQYFKFFYQFSFFSDLECQYLINDHVISRFIQFFLQDESQNGRKLTKRQRLKRRKRLNQSNFYNLIEFISSLVCRCYINELENDQDLPPTTLKSNQYFQLDDDDYNSIFETNFLIRLIRTETNQVATSKILSHWSWKNLHLSSQLIQLLISTIKDSEHDQVKPFFEILSSLLLIQDEQIASRIHFCLEKFLEVMAAKKRYPKKTANCIEFLHRLRNENPFVYKWLHENQEKWQWIEHWTRTHPDIHPSF